ncbi:MAG: diaminopimelate decarboxylase [Acidobacteria bacterium]|nr:diaminopimelate decarboxylase [Acidobacteriota bacterium]
MRGFEYKRGQLHCEDLPLAEVAGRVGTPCYLYSASAIVGNYEAYAQACARVPVSVHYSLKANSSLGVLGLLARRGAGFDIVSGGELFRVLQAGGDPERIVFSGVGKTSDEIDYALGAGIALFNCESDAEVELVNRRACKRRLRAPIALRVNPDVSVETHPFIATGLREHKFGIDIVEAEELYCRAARMEGLVVKGVSCHIGSQIFDIQAFVEALRKILALVERLHGRGISIRHLDLGGGLGVGYRREDASPTIDDYMQALSRELAGRGLHLMVEPGRSIVAQAGVLLATVLYRKRSGAKEFVILDAAMNDLIRPALYESYHDIIAVKPNQGPPVKADIVGPVCETGDFFARDREITPVAPGDLVAVCTVGAYGFVLSSNYNSRPRAAEVLVDGAGFTVIRDRETYADLIRGERTV